MSRAEMCLDRRWSPARLTIPYAIRTHVEKDDGDDSLQIPRPQFTIRDTPRDTLALRVKTIGQRFATPRRVAGADSS